MTRKMLPVVIGAILTGGTLTANADVTLFGHIDTSVDATDVDGGSDDVNLNCTTCSVGFKGSEDLGNGLKGIYQLEFAVDPAEDSMSWGGRNQFVGLAGGFGTVLFGRHDTPLKISTGKLDMFADTFFAFHERGGDLDRSSSTPRESSAVLARR